MKSLNKGLNEYSKTLKETEIQKAYKDLISYIKDLKRIFSDNHHEYQVASNIYLGYLDFTFFTFTTELTAKKSLKYAIVFRHEELQFEIWLSGRNRKVMSRYHNEFSKLQINGFSLTPDEKGMSSIIESVLVNEPDFDDLPQLTSQIEIEAKEFIKRIESMIMQV